MDKHNSVSFQNESDQSHLLNGLDLSNRSDETVTHSLPGKDLAINQDQEH